MNRNGFFVKDAHAILPLAANFSRLFLKLGKQGIKNFKSLLKGKTNLRVDRFALFGSMFYLSQRIGPNACPNNSCIPLRAENADKQFTAKTAKVIGNALVAGKFTDPRIKKNGEINCKIMGDTHGAVFELLMIAYYHATREYLGVTENEISAIEKRETIHLAKGTGKTPGQPLYKKPFIRYVDIALIGAGGGDADRVFVELKSLSSKSALSNRTANIASKFKQWEIKRSDTSYHRQFLLDRIAIDTIRIGSDNQHLAKNFEWIFQDWKHDTTVKIAKLDKGISVADDKYGKCGTKKENCLNQIRDLLTQKPLKYQGAGYKTIQHNWRDIEEKGEYGKKIRGFNVGLSLAEDIGRAFIELPKEIQKLEKTADQYLNKIKDIEQQVEELERKAAQEIERRYGNKPGYRYLKEAYEKADKLIDKYRKKAAEKLEKELEDIPELTLECSD